MLGLGTNGIPVPKLWLGVPMGVLFTGVGVTFCEEAGVADCDCCCVDGIAGVAIVIGLGVRLVKPGGTGGSADKPRWRRLQRVASN